MQRWGTTRAGKPRFRCTGCGRSRTRQRRDNTERAYRKDFAEWLLQGLRQRRVAPGCGITARAWRNRFRACWALAPLPVFPATPVRSIILDGTRVQKRQRVVLVVENSAHRCPIAWQFAERESYTSWHRLMHALRGAGLAPAFAVCDGQKGLLQALREVWPAIRMQRCLLPVVRQARLWLTQHPQTLAGQELLVLVRTLSRVRTQRQRRRWLRAYRYWRHRHDDFLKQRTHHPTEPRRWGYTHRKLRAVRSLLTHSLPELFR